MRLGILAGLLLTGQAVLAARLPRVEVVTSIPVETTIDDAGTRKAATVWREMIGRARTSLDLAEFYLTGKEGESLEPVVTAIVEAAGRGVRVRMLIDHKMAENSRELAGRLAAVPGITLRQFDWSKLTGGILHAKYFVVDHREGYVGSQNFDWRSLTHIHETGLLIRDRKVVKGLQAIFDLDWAYCGGDAQVYERARRCRPLPFARDLRLTASPARLNPPGIPGSLPELVGLLDHARERISLQFLTYETEGRRGDARFAAIDDALRRAAARGVRVRLLVADWNLARPAVDALKSLTAVPGIEVRYATVPTATVGFIPYARVIHSKVVRVDGETSWVGTSNAGGDYFLASRNVEVILRSPALAGTLDRLFDSLWHGPYVHPIRADGEYQPPRTH